MKREEQKALNTIYKNLMNGNVYGNDRLKWREDFPEKEIAGKAMFTTNLYKHYCKPLFCWQHYGSSANNATKQELKWIIENIFKCTPCEFLEKYMTRKEFEIKYSRVQ